MIDGVLVGTCKIELDVELIRRKSTQAVIKRVSAEQYYKAEKHNGYGNYNPTSRSGRFSCLILREGFY